jgi:aminopeptidase
VRATPVRRATPPLGLRMAELDFDVVNSSRRIIEGSLGVVAGERVAIIVDSPREALGNTLAEVVRTAGAEPELVMLEQLGTRPIRGVPEALRAVLGRVQASVMLVGWHDGERPMRAEFVDLVGKLNIRHAHMVGVTRRAMLAGFSVDPHRIVDATRAVRTRLRPDSVLRLRTPAGSDFEVKVDPKCRWQERVGIVRPGKWENLPSGELFTCPADANGTFVADGSMGGHFGAAAGLLATAPVRFEIKTGTVRSVSCLDRALARAVEEFLRSEPNADRVGMVILGTNIGMHQASGELVCDQNLPGLHIGFGATYPEQTGASWNAPTQLTMTAVGADVDLDNAPLLRSGRYLIL